MGLLSLGTPLPWMESREYAEHVRKNGIEQLILLFKSGMARKEDQFLWGDEVEYMLVKLDPSAHSAQLAIDEDSILERLGEDGEAFQKCQDNNVLFHPEYGRYMIEVTPLHPFSVRSLCDFVEVERNMILRRKVASSELADPTIVPMTLTAFPRMGCANFTYPEAIANGPASQSLFLPDEIINRHVRFPTLTANIRTRRGSKVAINVPLFQDVNTRSLDEPDPTIPKRKLFPDHDPESHEGAAKLGHIYMDAMGFGMGSSCLQVTMQASDVYQARYLYDSLANIAPLMLALTAAAPVFRGFLADQDVRWNVIAGSVDDRTPFERDVEPLPNHKVRGNVMDDVKLRKIPKSRYDSIDQYLGDYNGERFEFFKNEFNDTEPPINQTVLEKLESEPFFDPVLARHFAHLFIRDPLVIFNERIHQDNAQSNDHFENIQSTNWQTLRFKPPPHKTSNTKGPGWRVEFRTMEISLTDFENTAFADFVILVALAILKYKPNFYIPISLVEENMERAHTRDAILKERFHVRENPFERKDAKVSELSLTDIFCGSKSFTGLLPMVRRYVKETYPNNEQRIDAYLNLVEKRARGELPTTAKYIRNFVMSHKGYEHDSYVNEEVNFDLVYRLHQLAEGDEDAVVDFFGKELGQWITSNTL